jgi:hypothetical protein
MLRRNAFVRRGQRAKIKTQLPQPLQPPYLPLHPRFLSAFRAA